MMYAVINELRDRYNEYRDEHYRYAILYNVVDNEKERKQVIDDMNFYERKMMDIVGCIRNNNYSHVHKDIALNKLKARRFSRDYLEDNLWRIDTQP